MTWWRSKWMQGAVSLVAVGLIFGFLFPKLADYDEAWRAVKDMDWMPVSLLAVVAVWNLFSYLPLMISVVPGMKLREAAISNLASTAVANTLPGGGAIGVGVTVTIQRSFGIPTGDIALGAVVSGVWNNFAKLGLPVAALGLLAVSGDVGGGLAAAALIGLAVLSTLIVAFGLVLRSAAVAGRVGARAARIVSGPMRLIGRAPRTDWAAGAIGFRERTIGLIAGRGRMITAATVVSHVSLYLVLLVSIRAVGVSESQVGWIEILAAFAFVRLLSAIPITPGGLGVVELGLAASLGSGLPDPVQNKIAAAVLLYRALTWFTPIPLGAAAWTLWRFTTSRTEVEPSSQLAPSVS